MPATAYLAPQGISLPSLLNSTSSLTASSAVELDWEPFQKHVDAFLQAVSKYTLDAKTEIAARASDHSGRMRDLDAERKETERRIQIERENEGEMLAALEAERHVVTDLTSSLSRLQTSLAKVREESASVEAELVAVRTEVLAERARKERAKVTLGEMREQDAKEVAKLQEALGWSIESVRPNVLMMTFTLLDPAEPDREFRFLIDISQFEYTVPNCSPPLPTLPDLVGELNANRDVLGFIKRMRKAFRALLVPAPDPPSKFDDLAGPGLRETVGQSKAMVA